jgi:hypothetical protein
MFAINAYNQYLGSVKRIRNENFFEIVISTQIKLQLILPEGFSIELPQSYEPKSKF